MPRIPSTFRAVTSKSLDSTVLTETPEGIRLILRPAGAAPRLFAFLVDFAIRALVMISLSTLLGDFGGLGMGLFLITYFLVEWFYPVVFELTASGATPGKRLFNLKVVMDSGLPVTPAAALIRNLLRVADFLPFAFGFGLLCMLCRADFKRLGDLAAGTLVVYGSSGRAITRLNQLPAAPALRPADDLPGDAQAAIVNLAMRSPRLTPERSEELAALVPAHAAADPASAGGVARVLALARWLVGHRS